MRKPITKYMFADNDNYLIQRCTYREIVDAEDLTKLNIDSYLSFDYMGSAEFEFGAIGKTWQFIKENGAHYSHRVHRMVNGHKLYFYMPTHWDEKKVIEFMQYCIKHRFNTKERTDFEYAFKDYITGTTNVWLNINNGDRGLPWFVSNHPEPIFQIQREVYLHRGIHGSSKEQQQKLFDIVGFGDIVLVPDWKLGIIHDEVKGFGEDFITVKPYGRPKRFRADQCIFTGEASNLLIQMLAAGPTPEEASVAKAE